MSRKMLFHDNCYQYWNDGSTVDIFNNIGKWKVINGIVHCDCYDAWFEDTFIVQELYAKYWKDSITDE